MLSLSCKFGIGDTAFSLIQSFNGAGVPKFRPVCNLFERVGTDTNDTLKPTQGICVELLRFQIQYDIIISTNLNLSRDIYV